MSRYRSRCSCLLTAVAGLGVCVAAQPVMASPDLTLSYGNFAGGQGESFQLSGDATVEGGRIRLTRAVNELAGSAMHAEQVELAKDLSFSTYFTFRMVKGPDEAVPPADGIAFILHNHPASLGIQGHGIGYKGIDRSVAIEFDIFFNQEDGDPNDNHVGLTLNGDMKSLATAAIPHSLDDGSLQHAWIEYDGSAKKLEVRVSTTSTRPADASLSQTVDLSNILESYTMVGFTAGTGTHHAEQSVGSFHFIGTYLRDGIDPPEDDSVE